MPDVMHYLKIAASPDRVFEAITTADGVRNWWTRETELDPAAGGRGVFSFYGGRVVTKVHIDGLEPSAGVRWTVVSSTAPGGWEGTTISFDLSPEEDDTVLRFAHRGFREAGDAYARVTTGWAYFLFSLQQYLQTGQGGPAPDVDVTRLTRRLA